MVFDAREPDKGNQVIGAPGHRGARKAVIDEHRHHHVLDRRKGGNKHVILKDETDSMAPNVSNRDIRKGGYVFSLDRELARRQPIEQSNDIQQRALARPGRARKREELATLEHEIDVVKDLGLAGKAAKALKTIRRRIGWRSRALRPWALEAAVSSAVMALHPSIGSRRSLTHCGQERLS